VAWRYLGNDNNRPTRDRITVTNGDRQVMLFPSHCCSDNGSDSSSINVACNIISPASP